MPNNIKADVQKLEPGTTVELFDLDASIYGVGHLRFCAGLNFADTPTDVVWNGNTYTRFAIAAMGFEKSTSGTLPRPKLQASNVNGALSALNKAYSDLVRCTITRTRTLVKYLDAVNFPGGISPYTPDPTSFIEPDVYAIDRKSHQDAEYCEYELAVAFDVTGVKLPRRMIIQNICPSVYRSAECSYAGGPVATDRDVATSDPLLDDCSLHVSGCKLRFGATAVLPFGGFPGASLIAR